jgi:predicted phage terminase large subunit-like protein
MLWPIGFAKDENRKTSFINDENGHRIAAGMLAGVMGKNADTIILDDPLSDKQVQSDTMRNAAHWQYTNEVRIRLNVPGESSIVAIGQRLHEDDFFGHFVQDDEDWDWLVIPMRYESDHPYQRMTSIGWRDWRTDDGELMCPERFPEDWVTNEEKKLLAYGAAGQLQQRPAPRGGGMFKREWFELVDAPPAEADRVRGWDKAATKDGGAYTAGILLSRTSKGAYYVEDVVRAQVSPAARYALLKQTAELDAAKYGYGAVEQCIEHEGGSAGKDAAWLETELLAGHTVHCERPTGDKETRARPFAAQCEAGNVRIVNGQWVQAWLDELSSFPTGRYKDQVDASSAAFMRLATSSARRYTGPLIASGEDSVDEHRPFTDDELQELPEFLRELVTESRLSAEDNRRARIWGRRDDDWD